MSLKDEIADAVIEWLNDDLVANIKNEMNAMDVNRSRELTQSINVSKATVNGDGTVIADVLMESYWKYVNYGVNGTEVNHGAPTHGKAPNSGVSFHQAILEWIPQTGSTLPQGFASYDQWAYAIMTNIRKHGKKPRPFVDVAMEKTKTDDLVKKIVKLMANDIRRKNGNNDK
jgi:hypothetical protein